MEFRVERPGHHFHIGDCEALLQVIDPMAQVDRENGSGALRISTVMTRPELLGALRDCALVIHPDDLIEVPSMCCGSCSG